MTYSNSNCDSQGSSGDCTPGTVRRYPLGGNAGLILCLHHWAQENKYRFNRGRETGRPEDWPQEDWAQGEVYQP
jgi:hypothetical protein